MRRIPFELLLNVIELTNVPQLDQNKCFMVITVSNSKITNNNRKYHPSKITTSPVRINNHRCQFGPHGQLSSDFKLHADSNSSTLSDKWLCITFLIKHEEGKHEELLGSLSLNITEFVNETQPKEIRYLLEKSKTNTIVKLSIKIRHLENDYGVKYKIPNGSSNNLLTSTGIGIARSSSISRSMSTSAASINKNSNNRLPSLGHYSLDSKLKEPIEFQNSGNAIANNNFIRDRSSSFLTEPMSKTMSKTMSANSTCALPSVENVLTSSTNSPRSPISPITSIYPKTNNSNDIRNQDTQFLMTQACEESSDENTILNDLINKTYRFTWQLSDCSYVEYTPAECIRDIVEHNGNGWRKNDEGFDLIDVVQNEMREKKCQVFKNVDDTEEKNGKNEDDVFYEFHHNDDADHNNDNDNDIDIDIEDSDDFYSYYHKDNHKKADKVRRYKPLSEAEVREDLRSWHITVKN